MAKAQPKSYLVTDKSDLTYFGKTAPMGSVVNDLPGESIAWLLADGLIVPSETSEPSDTPIATPTDTPVDAPSPTEESID